MRDEQILQIKDQMRKRGVFRATTNVDNHASVDHIGEREELNEFGKCDNALMIPNANRTYWLIFLL